ncbi:MAG: hypothetical protein GF329_10970 [Candidatus Lokiarchaeota archaeon]|nr:hypothetical protein [Candidatus Lokiarchaeota archaeon]
MGSPFNEFKNRVDHPCSAGRKVILIRPDGYTYPCVGLKHLNKFNNGNNIYEYSLEKIWRYSQIFQKIRKYNSSNSNCITQRIMNNKLRI